MFILLQRMFKHVKGGMEKFMWVVILAPLIIDYINTPTLETFPKAIAAMLIYTIYRLVTGMVTDLLKEKAKLEKAKAKLDKKVKK